MVPPGAALQDTVDSPYRNSDAPVRTPTAGGAL